MAQSFKFYTLGDMQAGIVTFVTSEVAGREIEFAIDHNLDTYWKPTSTSQQVIDFDFGVPVTFDGWGVFIKNYTATFTGSIAAWTSTSGSSFDSWPQSNANLSTVNAFGVIVKEPTASQTFRYFRLIISTTTVIPELGQVFFFKRHNIATGNIFPELNNIDYAIKKQIGSGGRTFKRQLNRLPIETFGRTWLLSGDTDRDALQAMWDDSRGHSLPLVMQEDSNPHRIVDIVSPAKFADNQQMFQVYRPSITFRTLPYIEDGKPF